MYELEPLVAVGAFLREAGYHFVTPTPLTHSRVNGRQGNAQARSLRDVFGWSRPFEPGLLPGPVLEALQAAGALVPQGGFYRSGVRFSSLGPDLFVHSAYPTTAPDAVFFGPDTYRFAALLTAVAGGMESRRVARAVDIGCGSGAGGIALARRLGNPDLRLDLVDINEAALAAARVNVALSGLPHVRTLRSDVLDGVDGGYDLIVANPPYLNDPGRRVYRHGGGAHGEALSIRIVEEALPRLAPGGRLVLYTGVAIVEGRDPLRDFLAAMPRDDIAIAYDEIDPDVFGEELETPAYGRAERIAAVSLIARRTPAD